MDERRHILFDRFLSCLTGVVVAALACLAVVLELLNLTELLR